eukprot:CAMPEP_0115115450 /NCGR_PEP_ID=MMETSP0227-20121206/42694_1 /TAXON_ID=89957 /ORGANISM="Polarella glacialis, Strain CCMP 1383" /LENGTH=107 /DNA_ID=CAMNT_0002516113 /DNA_START=44 /DNA_END=367 /DNA_ORIENTATION=+
MAAYAIQLGFKALAKSRSLTMPELDRNFLIKKKEDSINNKNIKKKEDDELNSDLMIFNFYDENQSTENDQDTGYSSGEDGGYESSSSEPAEDYDVPLSLADMFQLDH